MPLVSEESQGHDRPRAPAWPWIAVAVSLALLWILVSLGLSLVARQKSADAPASPADTLEAFNSRLIQDAQNAEGMERPAEAAQLLAAVREDVPISVMDRHTYFRTGARLAEKSGKHADAARFHERFLRLGGAIHTADCRSCHHATGASIPPARLADLQQSSLGSSYVASLKKAGTLRKERDRLRKAWKKTPRDPGLNVLLFHLEERPLERQRYAEVLADLDRRGLQRP